MAAAKNPKKPKDFESALVRLEEITAELEAGELPLEKSIDRFAEGMELARFCNSTLEEARGRVELLLGGDKSGPLTARPFDPDGDDETPDESPEDDDRLPF